MKKTSQSNFKRIQAKPAKTHSPDFRAGNSIKPTRSPQNIQYILKQSDRHQTPVKTWQLPDKKYQPQTAQSRYFQNNRNQYRSVSIHQSKTEPHHAEGYCHNCSGNCHCVHAANNQQVVIQLKRIITMINGAQVSPFNLGEQSNIKSEIQTLKIQNSRLSEIVSRLKSKPDPKYEQNLYNHESEIKILKQQLNYNKNQFERQCEELYRTNKTLSSQVKSLEDRNIKFSKQIQSLNKILKLKEQSQLQKDSQLRKKNSSQKLSLSMIKDQYNSSIQTLKYNLQYQVNNQLSDNSSQINQYKYKLDVLQERLKICQKVNDVNKVLNEQNKRLKKQVLIKDLEVVQHQELNKLRSQLSVQQCQNKQKNQYLNVLNKQLIQQKIYYQKQIAQLKQKNSIGQSTQAKVKKLIQNYEQQIKILKKQAKANACNHHGIQQQNQQLRQQNQQHWQQVIKLRNQLVNYTSLCNRLDNQNNNLNKQNNQLKQKINNDFQNLTARINNLQDQNQRLKKQLQEYEQALENVGNLQAQNNNLKQQLHSVIYDPRINILQQTNSQLHKDLLKIQNKSQQLIKQKNILLSQLQILKAQNTKYYNQIKDLQKQLQQNGRKYEDQIQKLYGENYLICNDNQNIKKQFKINNDKIYQLQLTIRNLSKIIEDTQLKVQKLQDNLTAKYIQNQNLHVEMNAINKNYEQSIQQNIAINKNYQQSIRENNTINKKYEQSIQQNIAISKNYEQSILENNNNWQNQLNNLKVNSQHQINRLTRLLIEKQNQQQTIINKLKSKIQGYQSQSLKKQLEQLKKMVDQGKFAKIQQQLLKLMQNYQKQLIRSQQKILQIDSLTKDKVAMQQKISDLERLHLILDEKINIQEGNIKIVQNQLKQRKSMCESLLNQKIIVQKQNLMLKKIKLDRQSIEQTKNKAREISQKIDKLLAIQEHRQQNLMQASSIYTESMIQSRTRKI